MMFVLGALLTGIASTTPGGGNGNTPAPDQYAIVEFTDSSVATYTGGIAGYPATEPLHGHKLDLAAANVALYTSYLHMRHASFQAWVSSNAPWAQVVREYSLSFNGVAIQTNGNSLNNLANAPGVAAVTPDWIYYPTMDVSVPLIKANAVWPSLEIDPTTGAIGDLASVKVGVIDTGIDDSHPFIASCRAAWRRSRGGRGRCQRPERPRTRPGARGPVIGGDPRGGGRGDGRGGGRRKRRSRGRHRRIGAQCRERDAGSGGLGCGVRRPQA